jgi:hypothetical protein
MFKAYVKINGMWVRVYPVGDIVDRLCWLGAGVLVATAVVLL